MIHDSLGSVDSWGAFPKMLSQWTGRITMAYDRWGFGRSSVRHQLPSINFIDEESEFFLNDMLNILKIKKVILYGHSVGGAMALSASRSLTSQIDVIISEAAQTSVTPTTLQGIHEGQQFFLSVKGQEWLKKYHGSKKDWVLRSWVDRWLSDDFRNWNLVPALEKVTCPCLVLHGDRDQYGPVEFPQTIERYTRGLTEVELFKECGHIPHKDKLTAVLTRCRVFIEKFTC